MSLLRKIIDRPRVTALNVDALAWTMLDIQTSLGEMLADYVPALRWNLGEITSEPVEFSALPSALPEMGLFSAFGPTEKHLAVLLHFDKVFAQLISASAFQDAGPNITESLDAEAEISRLDILLLGDLIANVQDGLTALKTGPFAFNPELNFSTKCDNLNFNRFQLWDAPQTWMQVSLTFDISLEPTFDDEDDASDNKDKKAPEGILPETVKIDVFMPQCVLAGLMKELEATESTDDMSLDEGAIKWQHRIEKSHTSLRAIVESREMTVADCTRLEIGQIIPLPGVSLQKLSLEAELDTVKVRIATAALGIHKTRRALKLAEDIDPDFICGADVLNAKRPDGANFKV